MIESPRVLQVGVKAIITNSEGKYLFLKRATAFEGQTKPKWDIPGGRINPGEELMLALKREIKEETGMKVRGTPRLLAAQDILRVPDRHVVRLTYMADATGNITLDPKEHSDFGWFTLPEVKKLYKDIYLTPVLKQLA